MIRLIEKTDAQELFTLVEANRQYLRKWLPWLDFTRSIRDVENFISESIQKHSNNTGMVYAIIESGIVGICGFNSINHTIQAGYIGYWLAEDKQGCGFISRACEDLEDIGFNQLKLNKIEIHVATGNHKSRAVAKRLGYIETGTILDAEWLYDHYVDHVIYCKKAKDD